MKKCGCKIKRFAAAAVVSALLLCSSQSVLNTFAAYNDERFEVYVNMNNKVTDKYVAPNLYRQDSAYAYSKTFPLVVSGETEYVPITAFTLFSYLTVTYSKINDNFYITNSKNNNFISFDVTSDIAETNDGEILDLPTKIFYRTRYIPARAVAEVLGTVTCESYDDPKSGIYAFRIKDANAALSFDELLDRYLPKKKEPVKENPSPDTDKEPDPENTDGKPANEQNQETEQNSQTGNFPDTPVKPTEETPITEDPYLKIAAREMHFIYTDFDESLLDGVLNSYSRYGEKTSFSLNYSDIYDNPDAVRKIAVADHALILTYDESTLNNKSIESAENTESIESTESAESADIERSVVETADRFADSLDRANDALYAVIKKKTRLCLVDKSYLEKSGISNTDNTESFYERLKQRGYAPVTLNCSYNGGYQRASSVFEGVRDIITKRFNKNVSQKCFLTLSMSKACADYTARILEFTDSYRQFTVRRTDETMF